ncbi:hypothetical protein ACFLTN_07100 [Chloroflexota bacterium]
MVEHEVLHVAITPPPMLDEELVKKVAAIVAKNLYETRLRLTGKIPKIIANYADMQMAESTARSLRELGLVVVVFTESELRKSPQIYRARTLKFDEQAAMFWDRSGQARRVESREVFLIISGRMQICTETEVTTTVKKLDVTRTLIFGGGIIPIAKKVKEKTTNKSFQTESFVRLYGRTSPESVVELLQHDFDYSLLGVEMASSSVANFNTTVNKIRDALPEAIFDDRLVKPFGVDMSSAIPQDDIEMNCKLIYWYHKAVSNLGSSV